MNYSVAKRRESRKSKLQFRHFEQLFKDDSRVDLSLLLKFKDELDLEVVEVIAPNKHIRNSGYRMSF